MTSTGEDRAPGIRSRCEPVSVQPRLNRAARSRLRTRPTPFPDFEFHRPGVRRLLRFWLVLPDLDRGGQSPSLERDGSLRADRPREQAHAYGMAARVLQHLLGVHAIGARERAQTRRAESAFSTDGEYRGEDD